MRIAIYARKSKETDTGESIKNQITMCKDYFNRQFDNCTFEIFEDEGFSGGNIERPSFKRLMQLAKHKQFDIVSCYKIDRISRNTLDFLTIFDDLQSYDIKLVSITEGFDPSTPAGKMMMNMLSSMAEMERANIAQRVKDNMFMLAKSGRWSGGTPPFGFKSISIENSAGKKETYLEVIPEYQEKIKQIFNIAASGVGSHLIGIEVNMPSKTIYNILTNPVYLAATNESAEYLKRLGYQVYGELNGNGFLPYNRRPKKNGKKLYNSPDMFVCSSKHKAIIEPRLWILANNNILARGVTARPRVSPNSFLSHLVKCKCGSGMFVRQGRKNSDGETIYYFSCSAKRNGSNCDSINIRVKEIEDMVLETLKEISLDKSLLDDYIKSKRKGKDYSKIIKSIKADIKKKTNEINKLTEKLILIEGPAVEIITDKINEISKDLSLLNEDLFKVEREKIFQEQDDINADILYDQIVKLLIIFPTLDIEDKQLAIKALINSVTFNGKDGIKVKFN